MSRVPPTLALTGASLRRLLRDRTSLFFVVVLPIAIILILGVTIRGGGELRVGVVGPLDRPLAQQLLVKMRASDTLSVQHFDSVEQARTALRRVELDGVVVVPEDYDARLARGDTSALSVELPRASSNGQTVVAAVSAVVADEAARVQAATFTRSVLGTSFEAGLTAADRAAALTPRVSVHTDVVDATSDVLPQGFSYSAPTMLVFFVFINALAGGAAVIQTRKLGVYARALAAPVRPGALVLGETLSYLVLALLQSALIVGVAGLLFGVSWGDPLAATTLVLVWAVVGTGAGMLSGTLFRTPEQASSIGPAIGIAAGMLGGCMWPLAIVPPAMRAVGHALPHAWAVDAWTTLLSRAGGLADIAGPLVVLGGFAAALLVIATARLRRSLLG